MGIVLYEMDASPPCAAVRLTLAQLGINVNHKFLDYSAGEHLKPEYLKINPQYTVPTIDDDGFILWESRAIQAYLVDKYAPGNSLYPKDPKERAIVDRLLYFDIGTLYRAISEYWYPVLFLGKSQFDPEKKEFLDKILNFLEEFLSKTSYVAGNHLTIADFSIVASLSVPFIFDYNFVAFPEISAWFNKMKSEVPEFKEILEIPMTEFKESLKAEKHD